jgi:hypothetical protein
MHTLQVVRKPAGTHGPDASPQYEFQLIARPQDPCAFSIGLEQAFPSAAMPVPSHPVASTRLLNPALIPTTQKNPTAQ